MHTATPFSRQSLVFVLLYACQLASAQQSTRLTDHWEFLRQDLGGVLEAVHPVVKGDASSVPVWSSAHLPDCVNALDAVDPDGNYYRARPGTAVAAFAGTEICKKQFGGKIPVTIRIANSRDLEMIPSGLSDVNVHYSCHKLT